MRKGSFCQKSKWPVRSSVFWLYLPCGDTIDTGGGVGVWGNESAHEVRSHGLLPWRRALSPPVFELL